MTEAYQVDLSLTSVAANQAHQVALDSTSRAFPVSRGYIAGTGDGIFTLNGQPAVGEVLCIDATTRQPVHRGYTKSNGHWLVDELDENGKYLVIARDINRDYEPFAWDYVTPATDLTVQQQQELWQSWQTST